MFTDLVASTSRSARVGPARSDELRREHFSLVSGVLGRHRGVEVKTLGDGVMGVFDSVADAVNAAVALQQSLEAANRANPDAPELRIGLSVGEVDDDGDDVFGTPVVEASRLCDYAQPRQILVTAIVQNLAQGHCPHVFGEAGVRQFKGLPDAMRVHEVQWAPLLETGLVGDFAHVDAGRPDAALECLDLSSRCLS